MSKISNGPQSRQGAETLSKTYPALRHALRRGSREFRLTSGRPADCGGSSVPRTNPDPRPEPVPQTRHPDRQAELHVCDADLKRKDALSSDPFSVHRSMAPENPAQPPDPPATS